jgi:hypothetical protein
VLFLTLKLACPLELVVPDTVVMVELPPPWPRVTVLPETGLPFASVSVTVMVEVVLPSAGTDVALATTVEPEAETAPAVM